MNIFSQVAEEWVASYNGAGNGGDGAYAIALDSLGNVYVTGGSTGSGTGYDYATIKYNGAGDEQWVARYNGPGNDQDLSKDIEVDKLGNVYITGTSCGFGTYDDYATIKYNDKGEQQWVARYNGQQNDVDAGKAIIIDDLGNVYVTGGSPGSNYATDYLTLKYNASGIQQWTASYNGPGNWDDEPYAIAVDKTGNIYVTGESSRYNDEPYNPDYATIKYNNVGVQLWTARYQEPGIDRAVDIVVDDSGNVYVTGWSDSYNASTDYATIKYNNAGVEQWVARYNGPANGLDFAYGIALDNIGNVYVTGESYDSETYFDYATIKYNSLGIQQWVRRYKGEENMWDLARAIVLDSSRNVYVTGFVNGDAFMGNSSDCATIKYDTEGVQQWVIRYNGPANNYDYAGSIALDNSGNVYIAGWSSGSGTGSDYITIKYSQPSKIRDAKIVNAYIPQIMSANNTYYGYVEMKNTGSAVWMSEGANPYRLGAVGDSDDIAAPGYLRIDLGSGETISYGQAKTFEIIFAPDIEDAKKGSVITDWRMLQEGIEWFGETAIQTVQFPPSANNWEIFE